MLKVGRGCGVLALNLTIAPCHLPSPTVTSPRRANPTLDLIDDISDLTEEVDEYMQDFIRSQTMRSTSLLLGPMAQVGTTRVCVPGGGGGLNAQGVSCACVNESARHVARVVPTG